MLLRERDCLEALFSTDSDETQLYFRSLEEAKTYVGTQVTVDDLFLKLWSFLDPSCTGVARVTDMDRALKDEDLAKLLRNSVGAWDPKFAEAQHLYRHVLSMARDARELAGLERRARGPAGVIFEDLVLCAQLRGAFRSPGSREGTAAMYAQVMARVHQRVMKAMTSSDDRSDDARPEQVEIARVTPPSSLRDAPKAEVAAQLAFMQNEIRRKGKASIQKPKPAPPTFIQKISSK